ncbi:unnamed protein product, partial [marine sediment metagenome]
SLREAEALAKRTWEAADVEQKKAIAKEAGLGRSIVSKGWLDMSPPEQRALTLAAIPDRSLHMGRVWEIADARYYMQALQEQTGLSFYDVYTRMEIGHGRAKQAANVIIQRLGTDPFLAPVRSNKESTQRVAQEAHARWLESQGKEAVHPENLTPNEEQAFAVTQGIYRSYHPYVRYLRVMRTTPNLEAFKREFPDAPEVELAIALELKNNMDKQGLWSFLVSCDWGVIEWYDPIMQNIPSLFPQEPNLDVARGEARLMARESADYREQLMERNYFQRLVT